MYLAFVCGVMVGVVICYVGLFHIDSMTDGTLKIDHSNPEKDVYRLEIDNLDSLDSKTRIILKVDDNADLTQN